jgi:hypothetical protein
MMVLTAYGKVSRSLLLHCLPAQSSKEDFSIELGNLFPGER